MQKFKRGDTREGRAIEATRKALAGIGTREAFFRRIHGFVTHAIDSQSRSNFQRNSDTDRYSGPATERERERDRRNSTVE